MEQTTQWSVIFLTPVTNFLLDLLKQNCYSQNLQGF